MRLDNDIYSYAFAAHLDYMEFQPCELDSLFKKCLLIFTLQAALASYFYYRILEQEIQGPDVNLVLVRLMCAFIMHLIIHPEVRDASLMVEFLMYNRRKIYMKKRAVSFIIAFMKFFSGIYVEMILISMIACNDNIEDIIKDFVALGFIIEMDNYLGKNIDSKQLEELIEKMNEDLVIEENANYFKWLGK